VRKKFLIFLKNTGKHGTIPPIEPNNFLVGLNLLIAKNQFSVQKSRAISHPCRFPKKITVVLTKGNGAAGHDRQVRSLFVPGPDRGSLYHEWLDLASQRKEETKKQGKRKGLAVYG
jgi:hypothetical protein